MSYTLYNEDNKRILATLKEKSINLVYADMLYDDFDFSWVDQCKGLLKETGSIFIQTDYRSVAELKLYLDGLFGKENFVNWIIWSYDWGGRNRRRFARKHDDILWYSNSKEYKFYPERVAVPKKTVNTGFNPSGRTTKIPTDVWEDIGNFHTMSKERIKTSDGKNIRWQKSLKLMNRIILATTDEEDVILDPFMGSGSTGVACLTSNRSFIGIEWDEEVFNLASQRLQTYYEKANYFNTSVNSFD